MLTLDTSAVVGLADTTDANHAILRAALASERGALIVPAETLAEVTFMLERRTGTASVHAFLNGLSRGSPSVDHGAEFVRIENLMTRYAELPLGFADAAVVACAERNGGRVLTTDRRDFAIVARGEGTITVLP